MMVRRLTDEAIRAHSDYTGLSSEQVDALSLFQQPLMDELPYVSSCEPYQPIIYRFRTAFHLL